MYRNVYPSRMGLHYSHSDQLPHEQGEMARGKYSHPMGRIWDIIRFLGIKPPLKQWVLI